MRRPLTALPARLAVGRSRGPSSRRGRRVLMGLLLGLAGFGFSAEQEIAPPFEIQSALLVRVLDFDRSFERRSRDGLVIGVLYQSNYRESVNAHDGVTEGLRDEVAQTPWGAEADVVSIDLAGGPDLDAVLRRLGVDVLYIAPLRSSSIEGIVGVTRARGVLTFAGVPEYVDRGVSLSARILGGRPKVLVNRAAALAEGADFMADLLSVAEIRGGVE